MSVKRTVPAFTGAEASATACLSHGRGICFYRVGDYQIAPIAARSTAMGRWRLTPPGYGGTCLPAGRSVRGSDTPPACHSMPRTPQGESLRVRHSHRGPLKGKANGGVSFNAADPSRGKANGGTPFNTADPSRGKAWEIKRSARGRFFWFCLSLFGGAGQTGQGQE